MCKVAYRVTLGYTSLSKLQRLEKLIQTVDNFYWSFPRSVNVDDCGGGEERFKSILFKPLLQLFVKIYVLNFSQKQKWNSRKIPTLFEFASIDHLSCRDMFCRTERAALLILKPMQHIWWVSKQGRSLRCKNAEKYYEF